ncbi:MAG: sensor histidine kinase [Alteraurantiacibacter sp.]
MAEALNELDKVGLLEAVDIPLAVIDRAGFIVTANDAFADVQSVLGDECSLAEALGGVQSDLDGFVDRIFSSNGISLGSLTPTGATTERRMQLRGRRLDRNSEAGAVVRVVSPEANRFALLTGQVERLEMELQARVRAERQLTQVVAERELLLRELHHRVKNNMHMLSALMKGAAREAQSDEAREALSDIQSRVAALGTVQQLLYKDDLTQSVGSRDLFGPICDAAFAMVEHEIDRHLTFDDVQFPVQIASSLALVLNELLTNTLKYGRPAQGTHRVAVTFKEHDGSGTITVADNGPGLELGCTLQRASGLGLVKGLLSQLQGTLEIVSNDGAICTARFVLKR